MNIRIDGIELTAEQVREAAAKLEAAEKREREGGIEWPVVVKNDLHRELSIAPASGRIGVALSLCCTDAEWRREHVYLTGEQCDDLILALQTANMVSGAGLDRDDYAPESWQLSRLAEIASCHSFVRVGGRQSDTHVNTCDEWMAIESQLESLSDKPWEVSR